MRNLLFPQCRISGIATNMTMTPVEANVNACNQTLIKLLESPDRVFLGRRGRWYGRGAARGYYVLHQRVGLWICLRQPVSTQDVHLELGLPLFTEQPRRVLLGNPRYRTYQPPAYLLNSVNTEADLAVLERGVEELDQGYPHPVLVCTILQ